MRITTPLLLAAAAATTAIDSAPAFSQNVTGSLRWGASVVVTPTGDSVAVDTATLSVPVRHASPGGTPITLPVLRLRSTNARPAAPILYLAGGPGGSGLAEMRNPDRAPLLLAMRAIGDVILFDQRGTGGSRPSLVLPGRLELPSDRPITDPAVLAAFVERIKQQLSTLRSAGIDLDAYNTVENANDVDALRKALGVERVSLWGHSYGSHLAMAVLKQYGSTIDRVIVGGINGLHQRWRLPSDGDVWLTRIDSAMRADARLRAIMPSFLTEFRSFLAGLEREPIRVQSQGKTYYVGREEVAAFLALSGGDVTLVARLPAALARAKSGDALPLAMQIQQTLRDRPFGTAMTYSMHLASGVDAARAARIATESRTAILGNAINYPFDLPAVRDAFGITDLGDAFRAPVGTSVPTLFFSGSLDGRTSITDAEEVRRGFTDSRHLIIDGAGHNFYTSTPAVLDRMLRFMRGEPVRNEHLRATLEIRGPDEPKLIAELQDLVRQKGIDAAAARLAELGKARDAYLTSFVPGTVAAQLLADSTYAKLLVPLLRGAIAIFPASAFLQERLGEALLAAGDPAAARAAWERALAIDPYTVFAARQLKRIQ